MLYFTKNRIYNQGGVYSEIKKYITTQKHAVENLSAIPELLAAYNEQKKEVNTYFITFLVDL